MRHLERLVLGGDHDDLAGDPAEPVGDAELPAALAISCIPTQMPRNGRPCRDRLIERLLHAGQRREAAPAIGEGADAGQHHAIGVADILGRGDTTVVAISPSAAARSKAFAAERRLPEP